MKAIEMDNNDDFDNTNVMPRCVLVRVRATGGMVEDPSPLTYLAADTAVTFPSQARSRLQYEGAAPSSNEGQAQR